MHNYAKSRARKNCESEFAALQAVNTVAHSEVCNDLEIRKSVLSNSILIASAKVENYLADLVGDWVKRVNSSDLPTIDLPLSIRARFFNRDHVLGAYQSFGLTHDESALSRKVIAMMAGSERTFLSGLEPRPQLYSDWILKDCKYPSPERLVKLFKRMGVNDFFARATILSKRDSKLILSSFNDLRTELAHEGNANLTFLDVEQKFTELDLVIDSIDKVFFSHFGEINSKLLWTT